MDDSILIADDNDKRSPPKQSHVEIHPEAIVVSKAILEGNIVIGPGTIIHPQANINAGEGTIVFGANNIVEETAFVQNLGPPGHVMRIGDDNLFEIGSICHAIEIGDNNVFGIQSTVGPQMKITNGCRIGARCKLLIEEKLPPMTALRLEHNERKTVSEKLFQSHSQKSQTEFLKKLLPKYSEIIRNKQES